MKKSRAPTRFQQSPIPAARLNESNVDDVALALWIRVRSILRRQGGFVSVYLFPSGYAYVLPSDHPTIQRWHQIAPDAQVGTYGYVHVERGVIRGGLRILKPTEADIREDLLDKIAQAA